MFVVALFALAAGAWLLDSAVQNRNPVTSILDIVRDPSSARQIRAESSEEYTVVRTPSQMANNAGSATTQIPTTSVGPDAGVGSGKAAGAIAYARKAIGAGYSQVNRYGPNTYDCSGLMFKAYESVGVKIGTWTGAQILNGTKVAKEDIQPGDLVFPVAGHVGIATSAGWPCTFIDAPTWGKKVSERKAWGYLTARRVA